MAKSDIFWKCVLGFSISFGGAVGGAFGYNYARNYLKPNIVHQVSYRDKFIADVKIEKLLGLEVSDKMVDILSNKVPCNTLRLVPGDYKVFNQQGRKEDITDLIKRSVDDNEAYNHVDSLLHALHRKYYGPQLTHLFMTPQGLAKEAISLAWLENTQNMQHNSDYEMNGDSTQTWRELNHRIDKMGRKLGDCEDYTMELLTEYEIMRKLVEERKDTDSFYRELFNGLMRTQLVGISYSGKSSMYDGKDLGHEMMAILSYSSDFKTIDVNVLEPQVYQQYGDYSSYFLGFGDGQLVLWNAKDRKFIKIHKISYVYTGQGACVPKEIK